MQLRWRNIFKPAAHLAFNFYICLGDDHGYHHDEYAGHSNEYAGHHDGYAGHHIEFAGHRIGADGGHHHDAYAGHMSEYDMRRHNYGMYVDRVIIYMMNCSELILILYRLKFLILYSFQKLFIYPEFYTTGLSVRIPCRNSNNMVGNYFCGNYFLNL